MEALLNEPALNPPPGVVPNFADPGGSQSIGYGIVIASSIISTIAVLARLMSSIALKKFLIEDLLMVAALVRIHPRRRCSFNQMKICGLNIVPGHFRRKSIHHLRPHHLSRCLDTPVEYSEQIFYPLPICK
jgi:hypothetical protein